MVYLSFALFSVSFSLCIVATTTAVGTVYTSVLPAIVPIHYLHFRFHMKTLCNIYKRTYMFIHIYSFVRLIFYVEDESHFSTLKFRAHIYPTTRHMRYNVWCLYIVYGVCDYAPFLFALIYTPRVVYIVFYGDKLINKQRRQCIHKQTNTNILELIEQHFLVSIFLSQSLYRSFDHMVSLFTLWNFAFLVFVPSAILLLCECVCAKCA